MGISVQKVEAADYRSSTFSGKKNSFKESSKTNISSAENFSEINLNLNPKSVSFQGWFSKKKKAEEPPEPEIYGPYNLKLSQLKKNDEELQRVLTPLAKCLSKNADKNIEYFSHDVRRATDEAVEESVPICISLLACYQNKKTSYPEFYDSVARSFPKTCSKLDSDMQAGNMSKVYKAVREKTEEYGRLANPKTKDPFEDGIKYLYFANNLPLFECDEQRNTDSTEKVFEGMTKGIIPKLEDGRCEPACHMSTVENEINTFGTPYIIQHFNAGHLTEESGKTTYFNHNGYNVNGNYVYGKPEYKAPPKEPYVDDYWDLEREAWWDPDKPLNRIWH